jgi:hypothetical protein
MDWNMMTLADMFREPEPTLDRIMVPKRLILPLLTRYRVLEQMANKHEPVESWNIQSGNYRLAAADFWAWVETTIPATKNMLCRLNLDNATQPDIEITGPVPAMPEGTIQIADKELSTVRDLIAMYDSEQTALNRYILWDRLEELHPIAKGSKYRVAVNASGVYLIPIKEDE